MIKIRVKEFFEDMVWESDDKDWYHDPDGVRLEDSINEFLEENPNFRFLDIKYWVKEHKNGEDESQALLIYQVIDRQSYEKGDE